MRHFPQLDQETTAALFHVAPKDFDRQQPAELLAAGLGATLYLPAVRPNLADDIVRCYADGVLSMICCLEDSIRDDEVGAAEDHLVKQLLQVAALGCAVPMLFVRVRTAAQIYKIAEGLGPALSVLTGFVLPKFLGGAASEELAAVRAVGKGLDTPIYAMPILESPEIAHAEARLGTLVSIRDLLHANRDLVLAVRVGVTDMSGAFGLRRPVSLTAWDIGVIRDALTDIINVFTRRDGAGFVVVGPVWEYFDGGERSPAGWASLAMASAAGSPDVVVARPSSFEGLVRETRLDLANGLLGKTVIHPSHAPVVHALCVVSHEEYADAAAIGAETDGTGGVLRSVYGNKMNEVRPHRAWAAQTMRRAAMFGVSAEGVGFLDLIEACSAGKALV